MTTSTAAAALLTAATAEAQLGVHREAPGPTDDPDTLCAHRRGTVRGVVAAHCGGAVV